uniref:EGF-like domain-containing protein n=1 Tax=Meloidogyne incognita TaxID=6306 RepID=A0A914MPT7_MELIC
MLIILKQINSFYLFFIVFLNLFNLIIGSGQLRFQLTTFNSSEEFRIELCANEFHLRESSRKSEWGKDCKFGRAEVFVRGNGTFDERQQSPKTTSISLPFTHFWRQSFTLELRLWHDNELLLQKTERIFPLPVGSGWRSIYSNFNLKNKRRKLEILFGVDCLENFYGSGCDVYCKLNDLEIILDRIECDNESGLKKCKKGWKGQNCEQKILLNTKIEGRNNQSNCYCINGGKCVDNKCVCPVGYWGNNCEKCIPNSKCKGFCRQRPGECSCPEGKGGQFCEKDLIFCSKNSPCQNGGICQNNAEGNYTCKCRPGYGGINCERVLNNCEEEPCYNGAKCINLFSPPGFRCLCPPSLGLFGRFCEIKAPNGCRDLPCQNGGSCIDYYLNSSSTLQNNSFKCLCPDGWTGPLCELPWGYCSENPCQNGGNCVTDNFNKNGYVCLCPIGWSGINCENKINNCLINPCLNGGNCLNLINSFRCYCKEEWEGEICQNKIKRIKQIGEEGGGNNKRVEKSDLVIVLNVYLHLNNNNNKIHHY